jgi:hypothetical protein
MVERALVVRAARLRRRALQMPQDSMGKRELIRQPDLKWLGRNGRSADRCDRAPGRMAERGCCRIKYMLRRGRAVLESGCESASLEQQGEFPKNQSAVGARNTPKAGRSAKGEIQ